MKRILVALATLTLAAGSALPFTATASADPIPVTDYRSYAGAGSNTLQDVWNAMANGNIQAGFVPSTAGIAWWDAAPVGRPIKTKARPGTSFVRPTGSGAGLKALSRSWDPADHIWNGVNIAKQLDYAGSSAGPAIECAPGGTDPNCMLAYLPFARDALSVAIQTGKGDTVAVNVTRQQLIDAYSCYAPPTVTLSDGTSLTVNPVLPQVNSGTRQTFLKMLGLTYSVDNMPACVTTRGLDGDGREIPTVGDMIPFEASQYIAQENGIMEDLTGNITLASIDGRAAVTGTAPNLVPGPMFGGSCNNGLCTSAPVAGTDYFAHDVYNVILNRASYTAPTGQTATYPAAIVKGGALNSTLLSAAANTRALNAYGLANLAYAGSARAIRGSLFVPGNS